MPGDHGFPGQGKALGVELAVDAVAVLHVIEAGARLQQGMQQQAFLHGRQRIYILDGAGRHRQRVQLHLGQVRQGEVGRRQAAGIIAQAMGDQALQLTQVGLGQFADGLVVVTLAAEGPAQQQFAAVHLAVHTQGVGQWRIRVMGRAGRHVQRVEQRLAVEALVELPEVVEGNRGVRQRRHGLATGTVGQVAQHAIAQAFVRHRAQLLLDRLDRRALAAGLLDIQRGQAQRVSAGEPTDTAGQVDFIKQAFAAVAFQLDQGRCVAAPTAQHAGQCSQQ